MLIHISVSYISVFMYIKSKTHSLTGPEFSVTIERFALELCTQLRRSLRTDFLKLQSSIIKQQCFAFYCNTLLTARGPFSIKFFR